MENYTVEQMDALLRLSEVVAENARREAEAVQGYTEQLVCVMRAREAFAGRTDDVAALDELAAATREKIADELSHSDSLRREYTALTEIEPKEE